MRGNQGMHESGNECAPDSKRSRRMRQRVATASLGSVTTYLHPNLGIQRAIKEEQHSTVRGQSADNQGALSLGIVTTYSCVAPAGTRCAETTALVPAAVVASDSTASNPTSVHPNSLTSAGART
jgi:hypothetical protein